MRRPPYLRWIAAASIVLIAFAFEVDSRSMGLHPFLLNDVAPGEVIDEAAIEWREVPNGLLPIPDLDNPVAAHQLRQGDPLIVGSVTADSLVPIGWWSIPLNLPASARLGGWVRLILLASPDPGQTASAAGSVDGIVVELGEADAFSVSEAGLVAVPPSSANEVALAAAEERLMILYAP
jgi:hypothetical protein